jgi:hypothetical protein
MGSEGTCGAVWLITPRPRNNFCPDVDKEASFKFSIEGQKLLTLSG